MKLLEAVVYSLSFTIEYLSRKLICSGVYMVTDPTVLVSTTVAVKVSVKSVKFISYASETYKRQDFDS